jgi:cleavage and polyadenylation specificity factor subunit 2
MAETKCLRCTYILAVIIVLLLAGVLVMVTYVPQATNLVRSRLATVDVVVVGGGLAGASAAIEASRHGARVTIIDKERSLGGNSAKATSGINGAETKPQTEREIEDSVDSFIKDTIASGGGLSSAAHVEILARNSADAIDFLMSFGLNLTDVVQLGGHSTARTHRIPPTPDGRPIPVGFTIMSTLKRYIENDLAGIVNVVTNANFKHLITDKAHDNRVVGVEYELAGEVHRVNGNVILTAGGYANDHTPNSLLTKYVPQLASLPTTNGPWATGDIIKATSEEHLSLIHMDRVQAHPTGFIESTNPVHHTKFLAPEALRGCGAILLNAEGKRFVNELGRRDHVTASIFEHCRRLNDDKSMPVVAAMVMNSDVIERFGKPATGFYKMKGIIEDVGKIEGLANRMRVSVETLRDTFASYHKASDEGEDEFGKVNFPVVFKPTDDLFVAYITPALHYCMGGLEITPSGQVLSETKTVVPGLYAAGEVTGGVHGANRLGGNSLLECVVFGRIAGGQAAHFAHAPQ